MRHLIVEISNPAELLAAPAYGAGALIRWEAAPALTGVYVEGGTIPLVGTTTVYDIWDAAGVVGTLYRTRVSDAAGSTFSEYLALAPLEILQSATDYAAIREVLGLQPNELDLGDEVIERLPFAPQAERLIKSRVSNWALQMSQPDGQAALRTAAIYATAALLTEAWVTGGTVGLVRPREARNWEAIAARLWDRFSQWVGRVEELDVQPSQYALAGFRVTGPTSRRLHLDPVPPWWDYPPVWDDQIVVD